MLELKRGRGRPPKERQIKLITLDDALTLFASIYPGKKTYSKRTLYNMRCTGRLTKHGTHEEALVDEAEIIALAKSRCG